MYYCSIYSVGDLWSDEYLQCNHRIEKNDNGEFVETFDPVYRDFDDIENRKEFIKDCIFRLREELELLNKYGENLINRCHYED